MRSRTKTPNFPKMAARDWPSSAFHRSRTLRRSTSSAPPTRPTFPHDFGHLRVPRSPLPHGVARRWPRRVGNAHPTDFLVPTLPRGNALFDAPRRQHAQLSQDGHFEFGHLRGSLSCSGRRIRQSGRKTRAVRRKNSVSSYPQAGLAPYFRGATFPRSSASWHGVAARNACVSGITGSSIRQKHCRQKNQEERGRQGIGGNKSRRTRRLIRDGVGNLAVLQTRNCSHFFAGNLFAVQGKRRKAHLWRRSETARQPSPAGK